MKITEPEKIIAYLVSELQRIRDLEPEPFPWPPDGWQTAIAACAECKRFDGHPIQLGICDTHRQPIWDRERHEEFEAKALGCRASLIARDALFTVLATPEVTE